MGELTDKTKGNANEAAGEIKKQVGEATNDRETQAEGEAQKNKGKAQQFKGEVKGKLGDDI